MLETKDLIIEMMKGDNLNKQFKIQDGLNGKIYGIDYNYVADEILFIFVNATSNKTCNNYISNLRGESDCSCWNECACTNLGLDFNKDTLNEYRDAINKEKYEIVTNLETKVYLGNPDEDPLKFYNNPLFVREIKSIKITDKDFIIIC